MPPREANDMEIEKLRKYLIDLGISEVVVNRMMNGVCISIFEEYWTQGHKEKVLIAIWPQGMDFEAVYIFREDKVVPYKNWKV